MTDWLDKIERDIQAQRCYKWYTVFKPDAHRLIDEVKRLRSQNERLWHLVGECPPDDVQRRLACKETREDRCRTCQQKYVEGKD